MIQNKQSGYKKIKNLMRKAIKNFIFEKMETINSKKTI